MKRPNNTDGDRAHWYRAGQNNTFTHPIIRQTDPENNDGSSLAGEGPRAAVVQTMTGYSIYWKHELEQTDPSKRKPIEVKAPAESKPFAALTMSEDEYQAIKSRCLSNDSSKPKR